MASMASAPKGFEPGTASSCAARACRHLTRSGMPPAVADPGGSSGTPAANGGGLPQHRVAAVRGQVGRTQARVGRQPGGHLTHHAAGFQAAGRCAGTYAGQVEQGRERRPVGQPRRRLDHIGKSARAAVSHRHGAPWGPAELCRDRGLVGAIKTRPSQARLGLARLRRVGFTRARLSLAGLRGAGPVRARPGPTWPVLTHPFPARPAWCPLRLPGCALACCALACCTDDQRRPYQGVAALRAATSLADRDLGLMIT